MSLPPELICEILSWCSVPEIGACMQINREWYHICKEKSVWHSLVKSKYPLDVKNKLDVDSWQEHTKKLWFRPCCWIQDNTINYLPYKGYFLEEFLPIDHLVTHVIFLRDQTVIGYGKRGSKMRSGYSSYLSSRNLLFPTLIVCLTEGFEFKGLFPSTLDNITKGISAFDPQHYLVGFSRLAPVGTRIALLRTLSTIVPINI